MTTDTRKALAARQLWETIKILGLSNEKLALEAIRAALATQPAQPSAQGEAVVCVTEEMVTAYLTANDAYWKRIDGEPTKLGKWRNGTPSEATRVSLMAALASTPPPAVVEAVPLTAREIELIDGMIGVQLYHAKQCDGIANRTMADKQKGWDMERVELLRKLRGIAPKAAQPNVGVEPHSAGMRQALHDICEEWAGAECGEPVHAQEAYAIGLAKRMYRLAVDGLKPE